MKRILAVAAAAMTATLMGMSAASATIFTKDYHGPGVWSAYDDADQTYTMKFNDDGSKDGFWLVVSPGANPKMHVDEYAILYGDRASNRITAYTFDGNNKADSFRNGQLLASYDNAFSTTNGRTMFSLDVSGINGAFDTPEWSGVAFGEKVGVWFHQSAGSNFSYGDDGSLTDYSYGSQMWLDTAFDQTNKRTCRPGSNAFFCVNDPTAPTNPGNNDGGGSVPAPGGLALILMGMAGFGLRRKK